VVVFILPVEEQFDMKVASDHDFDIGVYEAGTDDTNRKTIRHEVQTEANLSAALSIGSASNYDLEMDTDDDGEFDKTLSAQTKTLDVVKPQITLMLPEAGDRVSGDNPTIQARYDDNPGGVGIDQQRVYVWVNDVDLTGEAEVQADGPSTP